MRHEPYNGYWNFETYSVQIWIDNEEATQTFWRQRAIQCWEESEEDSDESRCRLARMLKDDVEEWQPDIGNGLYADLLQAGLDEVNWHELADNLLAGVDAKYIEWEHQT